MDIAEIIRLMALDTQQELYSSVGEVVSINEGARTCTVSPQDGGVDILGVRLQATEGGAKGITIFPKLNSLVVVTFLNKNTGYLSLHTEVDGYIIETETESLKDLLEDLISAIENITVTTPQGPSTPPLLNAADFATLKTRLGNFFKD